MTRDVFISYSTHDPSTATAIGSKMEAAGIRCWIAARDMDVGRQASYGGSWSILAVPDHSARGATR